MGTEGEMRRIVSANSKVRNNAETPNFWTLRKWTDEIPKVMLDCEIEECCVNRKWRKLSG